MIDVATADLHDLATAAGAVPGGDGAVTYARADDDPDPAAELALVPGEDRETTLARIREVAESDPVPGAVRLAWEGGTARATGHEVVRAVASARLLLPPGTRIVAGWRALGPKLAQVALSFGADDLGAVGTDAEEERLRAWAVEAGRDPRRRDGTA